MKRILLTALAVMLFANIWQRPGAHACTNFIVGKKASADGSVICSYNADSYGAFMNLAHFPAAKHQPGDMRQIYDWDSGKYLGQIPEAAETYNVVGNINEWQVTIGETTFGGREEMVDTTGVIDYGSLIYIALQRSRNAREAIKVMTSLVEQYGYCSEGETFTICDPDEAWIMEMMGAWLPDSVARDKNDCRTVWVAMRVPDDMICGHANQSRITTFLGNGFQVISIGDLQKKYLPATAQKRDIPNLVVHSKNVVSYARKRGWFDGKDADFAYNAAYARPDFSGRRICDARVWQFFNRYADGMDRYVAWAEGKDNGAQPMPLWVKPNKKLTVQDVQAAMRDHFEGTPFALDQDFGGGIWEMPYRPTPLYFEVDGQKYFNERPTSTQQTSWSYVAQMRSWLPRQVGGCFWFGNDDGNMVAYTPVYCCATRQPECYKGTNADDITFNMGNAFWVENWVANMVYPRYSLMFPTLREVRDSLEQSYFAQQQDVEETAAALTDDDARTAFLTDYTCLKADEMLDRWKQLAFHLIVKFNDMTQRPVDENGQFTRNKYGHGSTVKRPGYPENFARRLVESTGDRLKVPAE